METTTQTTVTPEAEKLTREQINNLIEANNTIIKNLQAENLELSRRAFQLSDEHQWFTEEKETWGRGKKKREVLAGKIHWNEDFKDESTGEVVTVERSQLVRVDGEWVAY